ncbi:MAG TPA: NADH-quinone oxidoreductase subunit L [Thermoanaerobaculia bacterium]|jgi:NADH-quinone oxidoreductase subunit L|nr:NADH-quinone oxidoreductase subunit L [Thermoanaerobaculia bacterium]
MDKALLAVVLLPALGALINGTRAFARPLTPKNKTITNAVALGTTALSALIATFLVVLPFRGSHKPFEQFSYYEWIPAGIGSVGNYIANFSIDLAFRIDPLSCTMLMIVTWIGFLIHVYATGYMSHETGYTRFFTYLNLFMFMMLLLVLGANYIVMFVGWEGVGLCSYLLIGFYYQKNFASDAGKKAFIVNRIGDFGFILGIFLIFNTFGSADFGKVFAMAAHGGQAQYAGVATLICLLLFVGATGKSAQVPLYVWLPDAMAGPTPVSALIHAATMVTAGVYMVVRSNVLFRIGEDAMLVVAIVGAVTAIFAASIALVQNDIKKVLAYSTVSQLGYMFIGAGVGAFTAAIFHVMTHAFFKACLFLGAGSVIHGCGGEQDMRKMGGLKKYMPRTHITMLIATIAIAGIPPLAGFFSKDEILANAYSHHKIIWILGVITAGMTAFYMFRLYYMTFHGTYRGAHAVEAAHHDAHAADAHADTEHKDDAHGHHGSHDPHESPWSMTGVLMVLALLSILGGWVGWPAAIGGPHPTVFQRWLSPVLLPIGGEAFHFHEAPHSLEWILMAISIAVAVLGWFFARRFYGLDAHWATPKRIATKFAPVYRLLENKYWVDELYDKTVIAGTLALCRALWWFDQWIVDGIVNGTRHFTVYILANGSSLFDKYVVDGAVNGVASLAKAGSMMFRRMQSGMVQNYALVMGGGIVMIAMVYLFMKP